MKEEIKTSTTIIDLGDNRTYAEIQECRTDKKLEIKLFKFRDNPFNERRMIVKCIGTPGQHYKFMATVYTALESIYEAVSKGE